MHALLTLLRFCQADRAEDGNVTIPVPNNTESVDFELLVAIGTLLQTQPYSCTGDGGKLTLKGVHVCINCNHVWLEYTGKNLLDGCQHYCASTVLAEAVLARAELHTLGFVAILQANRAMSLLLFTLLYPETRLS